MTMFPGFDGLMTLSRRDGVDIRPTLLRVVTDIFVQAERHSVEEEQQFVELISRLVDQVDDATRATVRARLAIYPHTPATILDRLAIADQTPPMPVATTEHSLDMTGMGEAFLNATSEERTALLKKLKLASNIAVLGVNPADTLRSLDILEKHAFVGNVSAFSRELGAVLSLDAGVAAQIVDDADGEPMACALKALGMASPVYQRVIMFLNRRRGMNVDYVFRLSRLFDALSERGSVALVLSWRDMKAAPAKVKHRAMLHDDERQRARGFGLERPATRAVEFSRITRQTGTR